MYFSVHLNEIELPFGPVKIIPFFAGSKCLVQNSLNSSASDSDGRLSG